HLPGLLRSSVNANDALGGHRRNAQALEGLRRKHFVNQHVHSLSVPNEILRYTRITRYHDGVSGIVNAIAERWLDVTMIHLKRCDLHAALFIDDALTNIPRGDHDPRRRPALVFKSKPDIGLVRMPQVEHHPGSPAR